MSDKKEWIERNTVGSRIRLMRDKYGITQDELARETQISRMSISYYENDLRIPNVIAIDRISRVLNVSTDYLIKGGKR